MLSLYGSTISAHTVESTENTKSVPVKHWEFDYFNYGVSAGQETVYLNFSMALRYNFDTPLVDVGGEFTIGVTPLGHYDPLKLSKGTSIKKKLLYAIICYTLQLPQRKERIILCRNGSRIRTMHTAGV